jgi:Tat protein secretion system quality control protein TatD with DNase activity
LVAEEISNILELELEKVAKITTKNAIEIFNLPISS